MTTAEAKAEFEKLAKENGIPDDQVSVLLQAFSNEKFAAAVGNGYTRHSEYSSALDKAKNAEKKAQEYEKWYTEQAAPAMGWAKTAAERLQQYEDKFGSLDNATAGEKAAAAAVAGISEEKLNKTLETRMNALSSAFVDYERTMGNLREMHRDQFKSRLPVDDLEKFMRENKITDLERGYELFTKPKLEEVRKNEREEERKRDREEWEKDFRSRNAMPKQQVAEKTTVFEDLKKIQHSKDFDKDEAEANARSAFLNGWNETAQ